MKNTTTALIFGLAIVLAALALGNAFKNRNRTAGDIYVTGLGQADFTSDLMVWEGRFGAMDRDLKQAYVTLERNKSIIREYLVGKGIPEDKLVFSAVRTNQRNKALYSPDGDYMGEEFVGYELSQSLTVESPEVEQIERISREVTELLNQGVQFYSDAPRYYYTKLGELKIEMIGKATEDARVRAEQIATNAGSRLGDLRSASMGVFQITGQNSDEEYSWGGTFNTSDRDKTASITVKLEYEGGMIHRAGPLLLLLCTSGTLAAQEDTLDLGELRYEVIDEADFLRHREQGLPAVTEPGELTELGDGRLRLTHGDDTLTLPERLDTCMLHGFVPALHAHYLVCFAGDELNTLELVDARTGTRMDLPYTFDNGFHGLAVSPGSEQVLFFSSYDIPSWEAWYDRRADLITYRLTPGKGLAGMRTGHTFETGRFSMEEVVWVDDRSVAMKVYFGDQPDERNAEKYTYLRIFLQ